MSRINTSRITGKIRIRFMRPWRGYPVGAVIQPPGAMRQILLQAKDQLGNKVAEEVIEEEMRTPVFTAPADDFKPDEGTHSVESWPDGMEPKRGRGRPRKESAK